MEWTSSTKILTHQVALKASLGVFQKEQVMLVRTGKGGVAIDIEYYSLQQST